MRSLVLVAPWASIGCDSLTLGMDLLPEQGGSWCGGVASRHRTLVLRSLGGAVAAV